MPKGSRLLYRPSYLTLYESGELKKRIKRAYALLESCELCPRKCQVNRLRGEKGFCRAGSNPVVASYNVHHGEEPPLSGRRGSGTIFFTHCILRCLYCQNYPLSQGGVGKEVTIEKLAQMMVSLQSQGCHNINFVTPSHFVPQILKALHLAIELGLHLPLVYNCGGYESPEALQLLSGVIDIYLPDAKYADNEIAKKYSSAPNYFEVMKAALKEMYRQVGDLVLDEEGIAQRGLIVRHLILPGGLAGTEKILPFIAKEISSNITISLMAQYFPAHKAASFPPLDRKITPEEYQRAIEIMEREGLEQGWYQQI